jgi:hypothetical protein
MLFPRKLLHGLASNYEIEAFKPLFTKLNSLTYLKLAHHKIFG